MSAAAEPAARGSRPSEGQAPDPAEGQFEGREGSVRAYFLGRVLAVAVIVGIVLVPDGFAGTRVDLGLLAGMGLIQLGSAVGVLRREPWLEDQRVLLAQLALDVAFVTVILHSEGGALATSPLFPLYFLPLLLATQLLPLWGQAALLAMSVLSYLGVVAGPASLLEVVLDESVQLRVFAMLLVVLLTGLLVEQVRRSARRELQRSEQVAREIRSRQELLLDELSTGVLVVDGAGRVQVANPAAQRLLGNVVGLQWRDVLGASRESTWEHYDGYGRTFFCSRNALEAGGDVVLVEDVTRIRQMEADVVRMERMAAVGRLAAGLAHEIRNPLASLSGSVQLLASEEEEPLLALVLGEVDRLNRLVEDFLDVSRPLELDLGEIELSGLVRGVAATFAHDPRYAERVRVEVEPSERVEVLADEARLRQVIWNLLLNAAQHVPMDGTVRVRTRRLGRRALVEVEDDGVGIAPAEVHRIFDPFFTTRVGGTGLGLANVERIVKAHGGEVAVESSVGQGTCFRILLPFEPPLEEDDHAP